MADTLVLSQKLADLATCFEPATLFALGLDIFALRPSLGDGTPVFNIYSRRAAGRRYNIGE
jgi:hypothetical protein